VRVVHHEQQPHVLRRFANRVQRRNIPVHAEDAVRDDEAAAIGACLGDLAAQVVHVAVGIAHDLGPAQAAAVDDAGVVQLIREDGVLRPHQRRDRRQVGRKAALERDARLSALEFGEAALQLHVQRVRAGDGAHCAGADAEAVNGVLGGCS